MAHLSLVASNVEPIERPRDGEALPSTFDALLGARAHELASLTSGSVDALATLAPDVDAVTLACDLAHAHTDLATCRRMRATTCLVHGADAWEVGLERVGRDVLATVFRSGACPEVLIHENRIDAEAFRARLSDDVERLFEHTSDVRRRAALQLAREALARATLLPTDDPIEPEPITVEPSGEIPVGISAEIAVRHRGSHAPSTSVLRTDLLSLLFRGRLRVAVGEQTREVADVFVFIVAEQLVSMCLEALEAWLAGRAYHRRLSAGGAICGIRIGTEGTAFMTLGRARRSSEGGRAACWTFADVDVPALVQGIVGFGKALVRSLIRRDRAQATNLRLVGLRSAVRDLAERLRDSTRDDAIVNASPESYRAFAAALRAPETAPDAFGHARLRFTPKWFAAVPSIDLRATFLCGDALIVGGSREMACIDGRTGDVVWRQPVPRAVAVVTPAGIARLEAGGALTLHAFQTGEPIWVARLAPRVGGLASGAVVSAPGLPRLLIVSEGARHLACVDLATADVRWRHAVRRGRSARIRRAGKLAIVTNGEPALTALDVMSGEVVWRFCDRLRFASPVAVDHDALFAIAGDGALIGRGGRLHHIDPWSGAVRWTADLPAGTTPVGAPLVAPDAAIVITHGRRGTGLLAFDRATGAIRFQLVACTAAAACMVIDDLVVLNSEGGELVGIDTADGSTRYRHVFSAGADGDRPRRLDPVLRSGALFVPQREVHVVRPRDGTILGQVPTDLVPDLLRVDERCEVYVVEESGHLAAFAAAPRLALVR